ncbi:MAG: PH domain-containing protein [Dermatophilaceae bacterium]
MSQSPAERDLAYARGNERLREHLTANEEIRVAARQHWWVLAKPFAIAVGLTLALIWSIVGVTLPLGSSLSEYLVAIALVGWAYFWWQWLSRRHDVFVVTDKRILKYQGLIIRDVPMMRISKITDMRYTRGALGEILGFGQIIIESAGQEQALRDLPYLSDPLENYRRLCEVIFGQGPSSSRRRQRRLPFLPRRVPAGPPPQLGPASQPGPATAYPKPGAPWHSPAAAGPSAPPHPWPREERIYSSSDPSGSNANPTQPIPLDERRTRRRRTPWEFYPEQGD